MLVVAALAGYLSFLAAWLIISVFARAETLSGPYARGFAVLVLPPLLFIPVGLTVIVGFLGARAEHFENDLNLVRMACLFAIVFCVASVAAFLAFFFAEGTALHHQPHVLVTSAFCGALATGNGLLFRRVDGFALPDVALSDFTNGR